MCAGCTIASVSGDRFAADPIKRPGKCVCVLLNKFFFSFFDSGRILFFASSAPLAVNPNVLHQDPHRDDATPCRLDSTHSRDTLSPPPPSLWRVVMNSFRFFFFFFFFLFLSFLFIICQQRSSYPSFSFLLFLALAPPSGAFSLVTFDFVSSPCNSSRLLLLLLR